MTECEQTCALGRVSIPRGAARSPTCVEEQSLRWYAPAHRLRRRHNDRNIHGNSIREAAIGSAHCRASHATALPAHGEFVEQATEVTYPSRDSIDLRTALILCQLRRTQRAD